MEYNNINKKREREKGYGAWCYRQFIFKCCTCCCRERRGPWLLHGRGVALIGIIASDRGQSLLPDWLGRSPDPVDGPHTAAHWLRYRPRGGPHHSVSRTSERQLVRRPRPIIEHSDPAWWSGPYHHSHHPHPPIINPTLRTTPHSPLFTPNCRISVLSN